MKKVRGRIFNFFIIALIPVLSIISVGCKQRIKTESEYYEWINNADNGCVVGKDQGKLCFIMKYLHPEFLAFKEGKNCDRSKYDSLKATYDQSRTFVFSLRNSDPKFSYDVLYINANNPVEYSRRLRLIQFDMTTSFYIKSQGSEVYPKLCTAENNYGLSTERRIILVFDKKSCPVENGKITICYDDKIFGYGLTEFEFDINDIDNKLSFDFI